MSMTRPSRGGPVRTAIAIVLLAVMLFPVYWMLNISLQPTGGTLAATFFPLSPSLDGYRTAHRRAGRQPGHQPDHRGRHRGAQPADRGAVRRTRWPSSGSAGSDRRCSAILISQMIPGIVIANGLYSVYESLGLLNSIPGLIVANSTSGHPVRDLDHAVLHARRPALAGGGRPGGRGGPVPGIHLDRAADQPELADHRRPVRVHLRLGRLPLRADADHQGRDRPGHAGHLHTTSAPTCRTGAR